MQAHSVAFNPPENRCRPACARPIDLDHLARQTMGQKDLETEVLTLFLRQARQCVRNMATAGIGERSAFAHSLKGSARGVGAFPLAERAERLEADPASEAAFEALAAAVIDVENFLTKLAR
jgi:HPt (histidine-containing phosphotransfer) domain-containing protein